MRKEKQRELEEINRPMNEEAFNNLEKKYQELAKVKAESEQIEEMYKDHRYKKECPFCHSICKGFIGGNLFCRCNAKYYYEDKVWLDRNTGKEIWDDERRKTN